MGRRPCRAGHRGHCGSRQDPRLAPQGQPAQAIYRELAAARPDAFRPALAVSLYNLAARLAKLGRREDAPAAIEEATGIRRKLAARWPDAYYQELRQLLQVVAWLGHGESDASPHEPNT